MAEKVDSSGVDPSPRRRDPIPEAFGFDTYLSPFTFKYGSPEMRRNWSQRQFWLNVRTIQLAGATVQHEAGVLPLDALDDLVRTRDDLNVARILNLEAEIGHDQIAANKAWSEVSPIGGPYVGNGFTSEDSLSNAEIMQTLAGFRILRPKLTKAIAGLGEQIEKHKGLVCMGYTHLQAAEPTTMGYRFARYAQNLLRNLRDLDKTVPELKGKGLKGPVGTGASFENVLEGTGMNAREYEDKVMESLGLPAVLISCQTYPRGFLFDTTKVLAGIGLSLHQAALDIQILQSSNFDEVSEPRRSLQPGSAAMPHKQNPVISENVDAITELLPAYLSAAWTTGAFQTLERTLRDSAGKRTYLPESFLIVDEALTRSARIFSGLRVHENSVRTNLRKHAPFSATEIVLGRLVDAGADRIKAHEWLVGHSEVAKDAVRSGEPNPIMERILRDQRIISVVGRQAVLKAFEDIYAHVGDAEARCEEFLQTYLYPAVGK